MKRVVKNLEAINGKMFVIMSAKRLLLFECSAKIELIEDSTHIPILGRGSIVKNRNAALLITFNQQPCFEVVENELAGFDFEGDFLRNDGIYEKLVFTNCLLDSDLDLTNGGQCRFELQCTQAMINKLKTM